MKNIAEKFETRSSRTGERVFVVRCCNWSIGDLTEAGRDTALAQHAAEFHPPTLVQPAIGSVFVCAIQDLCADCFSTGIMKTIARARP